MEPALIDCRGLNCPIPIVRISRAMKVAEAGTILRILATDPAFGADLRAWVEKMGHEILRFEVRGAEQEALVQRR